MDWAQTTAWRDDNHLSFDIWCVLYYRLYGRLPLMSLMCGHRMYHAVSRLMGCLLVLSYHQLGMILTYTSSTCSWMYVMKENLNGPGCLKFERFRTVSMENYCCGYNYLQCPAEIFPWAIARFDTFGVFITNFITGLSYNFLHLVPDKCLIRQQP